MKKMLYSIVTLLFIQLIFIPSTILAKENKPIAQEKASQKLTNKQDPQDAVAGEVIIKFKNDAPVGEVAEDLFVTQESFSNISNDSSIDRLNKKFKTKSIRRLFGKMLKKEKKSFSHISRQEALIENQKSKDVYFQNINEKKLKKNKKSKKVSEHNAAYLGNVYLFALDENSDLTDACQEYILDADVEYCQPNYLMSSELVPNDPYYSLQGSWGQVFDDLWGLKNINMETAWDMSVGTNIIVAVVDSGVDFNHVDIADNLWVNQNEILGNSVDDDGNGYIDDVTGWDFFNADNNPSDGNGHGTHVAGTIAAVGQNGLGIIGVAPDVKIMPLQGLGDTGNGSTSALSDALIYAAMNDADVINNSWGCSYSCPSNPLVEDAVSLAHEMDVVVVFSAGNSNNDVSNYSPQNQPETIAVAAVDYMDNKASFSNYGYLVDITAPGVEILSLNANSGSNALAAKYPQSVVNTDYLRLNGTSMAAPHVSGVAALIRALNPNYTNEQVRQALRVGSVDIGTTGFDQAYGYGRLDANAALSVSEPLEVLITSSFQGSLDLGQEDLIINGVVNGSQLTSWILEYCHIDDLSNWVSINSGNASVDGGLLGVLDLSLLKDGDHVLKLSGFNQNGEEFLDHREFTVNNVDIYSPQDGGLVSGSSLVDIKGTLIGPISNYEISYGVGHNPQTWSNVGVAITGLASGSINNDTIATWNTNNINVDGFYSMRLHVDYIDGTSMDQYSRMIQVDKRIKTGFPIHLDSGRTMLASERQPYKVVDLNNDGYKEVIAVHNEKIGDVASAILYVYHYDGSLAWSKILDSDRFVDEETLLVTDIDNDGLKEIFVKGDHSLWTGLKLVQAFQHDGSNLSGWPIEYDGFYRSLIAADLDRDGLKELIFYSFPSGTLKIVDRDGNIILDKILPNENSSNWSKMHHPAVGQFDDSDDLEIAVMQNFDQLAVYKMDGTLLPGWPQTIGRGIISSLAVGDIDQNGKDNILINIDWTFRYESSESLSRMYAFDELGNLMPGWPVQIGEIYDNLASPVLADFNGDGYLEISLGVTTGFYNGIRQYLFDYQGNLMPGWPQEINDIAGQKISSNVLADINGDGLVDILLLYGGLKKEAYESGDLSESGGIWAWSYDGSIIKLNYETSDVYPFFTDFSRAGGYIVNSFPPTITDLDSNGKLDLVMSIVSPSMWDSDEDFIMQSKWRNSIYAIEFDVDVKDGMSPWPMNQRDECLTGRFSTQAPVFDSLSNVTITEGELLSVVVKAKNLNADTLVFSAQLINGDSLSSIGVSFVDHHNSSATLSWTPGFDQEGSYDFIFTAKDPYGLSSSEMMTITVEDSGPINVAPVLNVIGSKNVDEGVNLTFDVSATDSDGDTLVYSVSGLPVGASFTDQTFDWMPTMDQAGQYVVVFSVSDGELSDEEEIIINVNNVSLPISAPSGLSAEFKKVKGRIGVQLSWVENTETSVVLYNIFRSETQGGPYALIDSAVDSSYRDAAVKSGTAYYVVTAVDLDGGESSFSNEASVGDNDSSDDSDDSDVPTEKTNNGKKK